MHRCGMLEAPRVEVKVRQSLNDDNVYSVWYHALPDIRFPRVLDRRHTILGSPWAAKDGQSSSNRPGERPSNAPGTAPCTIPGLSAS